MKFLWMMVLSISAHAYVDLSIQYSISNREAINDTNTEGELTTESKTISATWAWYIWEYTALEFNYSKSEESQLNTRSFTDGTVTFNRIKSVTITEVKGAGLRLSFAKRRAFIVPSLSAGYALLTTSGDIEYDYEVSGTQRSLTNPVEEETSSSSYVTAGLRINFSKYMGLSITGKSVMEDFKFSEADKNITYLAGLSWIF